MRHTSILCLVLLLLIATEVKAGMLDDVLGVLKRGDAENMAASATSTLSDKDIAGGLKQALQQATRQSVRQVGHRDGYWKNDAIRIPLPESWQKAASLLRQAGMGSYVDDLELRINRAAEKAAPKARPIFFRAVRSLTFEDVRKIWKGPEDAATRYFERNTRKSLGKAFAPVVHHELEGSGAIQSWRDFTQRYASLPLVGGYLKDDLDAYVTDAALQGLFLMLAQEEARIRHDPAARTTELLRRVFQSSL